MKKQLGSKPLLFPMPAVMVGTYCEDGNPDAMTAAWCAICCEKPVCAGVAVRKNRMTFANILQTKAFTLNVPSTSQTAEVDYVGIVSGNKEPEKLSMAKLDTSRSERVNAPIIDACPVNVECRLVDQMELGSHTWFAGEIMEVHVDEKYVLENGKLDVRGLDPLIYITSQSQYFSLGDPVADAYSIGKKIKKG